MSQLGLKQDPVIMPPHERLALAQNDPLAKSIVFAGRRHAFLAMSTKDQTIEIETRLSEPPPTTRTGRIGSAAAAATCWFFTSIFLRLLFAGSLDPSELLGTLSISLVAGLLYGLWSYRRETRQRQRLDKLRATYNTNHTFQLAPYLWLARIDLCLEPLEAALATRVCNGALWHDPHLHEARAILAEMRRRQARVFVKILNGHEADDLDSHESWTPDHPKMDLLFEGALTLIQQAGAADAHVSAPYRGSLRVALEKHEEDGDEDPATNPSDKLAHKKAG